MTKRLAAVEETAIFSHRFFLHQPTANVCILNKNDDLGLSISITLGEWQVYFVFDIWATNDGFTDSDYDHSTAILLSAGLEYLIY